MAFRVRKHRKQTRKHKKKPVSKVIKITQRSTESLESDHP